jgi:hypothetical protein
METRSARILALLLALIMLGSVLAYAIKRSSGSHERKNVEYVMGDDFRSYMHHLPAGVTQAVYMDLNTNNETLRSYVGDVIRKNLEPYFFNTRLIQFTHGIERMMVAAYPDGILYFVDVNKSKVFFKHDKKENHLGYTVKKNGDLALTDEIAPVVYGTSASVARTIDVVTGNAKSQVDLANYTERLPYDNYNLALVFYGDAAKELMKSNGTGYIDFYFAGFRMNGSEYEKVVGMHFVTTGLFVRSNVTAYYNYTNYEDGFSVAVMRDTNFTKILEAQPEVRVVEIKLSG